MKTVFRLFIILFFAKSYAQVGINTTTPEAQLEVKASNQAAPSNTDGIIIPRVDAFPLTDPTAAQQGMMVYLMVTSGANPPGFYYWDNLTTSWIGISSTANGDKDWYKVGTTTAPTAITDDMFHTGKVGIGNANPFTNLHVTNNSTGMSPNTESVAIFENTTNAFINVLSNLESGVLFGANGNATNGGIIYNPTALPNSMLFRTNGNVNRMVISNDGNIALGNFIPTLPLQFTWALGDKISFWGGTGDHYGIGIQNDLLQVHSNLVNSDIAFGYGNSASFTERMRIKGTGNVGVGTSNPSSRLHIQNGSSAITANGSAQLTVEGSGTNVYTNILSTQETGVLFGASGASNNGGLIYNPAAFPNSMFFRTGGNINRMTIGATGNVGIGVDTPLSKLHIKTVATGMTPNPFASATIEDDQLTFLNLLSNQESGVVFGTQGIATSGGVIYSPTSMPKALQFRTNNNDTRMTISDVGNVALGNFKADFPLHFGGGAGDKVSFFGGPGAHLGIGIQDYLLQIHGGIAADDIAFGYGTSAAMTEVMRIKGTGNVGIGTAGPSSRLHVQNGSSTITANGSSLLTVEGSGTNVYTNILSTQETGVLFGASGASNNGGLIYNAPAYPNSMLIRTGGNANRMVIGSTGNVAIGNFTPDYPLHFPASTGDKISLFGGTGPHYGFGIQGSLLQIHSGTSADDIAFGYGSSAAFTERMRIKGTGEVGIGTSTPTAELEINGFTKMGGSTAPAVKMIKLTGTTNAAQGSSTSMAHGLTSSKILAVNILVEYSAGNSVPPSYTASAGYEFDYFISGTNVTVVNKLANSSLILSKPIRVLVTYEE